MDQRKSFTLIELLVVIAIIGLIASIVLVNVGGLQGKARLTKTLEFSQSINNALGAYMVGYWSFDDQASPTKDGSGYNNHGTLVNAPTFNPDTPYAVIDRGTGRYALSFNGSSQYVDPAINPSLSNYTWEAWVKADDVAAERYAVSYSINHMLGVRSSKMYFWCSSFCVGGAIAGVTTLNTGQWYYFLATYNGTNVSLYLNGQYESSKAVTTGVSSDLLIGKAAPGFTSYWDGLLDEVKVYEKALTLGEIQQHYVEGLKTHKDLAAR